MKRLFFTVLLVSFLSISCSIEDENPTYEIATESVPITSVVIPDAFEVGRTYNILVNYLKPSTCHTFREIILEEDGLQRTVIVTNDVLQVDTCTELPGEFDEVSFSFTVIRSETHIFKFWQGKDADGEDIYMKIEVPITN